jgi:maleate cis-trans isomerase
LFIPGRAPQNPFTIETLEQDLWILVVTANQAMMRHAVRPCGVLDRLPHFGRLFALSHRPAERIPERMDRIPKAP